MAFSWTHGFNHCPYVLFLHLFAFGFGCVLFFAIDAVIVVAPREFKFFFPVTVSDFFFFRVFFSIQSDYGVMIIMCVVLLLLHSSPKTKAHTDSICQSEFFFLV